MELGDLGKETQIAWPLRGRSVREETSKKQVENTTPRLERQRLNPILFFKTNKETEMQNSKTRFLIPLALCAFLLIGAGSAFGQVAITYDVFSTPTFLINVGRAEVIGAVRIRANIPAAVVSIATTAQFLYLGVPCDNNATNGITITRVGFATAPAISGVSNGSAGCVVSITVASQTVNPNDYIDINGVRGRIDLSTASVAGTSVLCSLSATPSNSALYTNPTVVNVAVSAVGRIFSIRTGNQSFCGALSPAPRVQVTEGFNGAFVQHVVSNQLTAISQLVAANARPVYGGINNTQVNIVVTNLPTGVTLVWPNGADSVDTSSTPVNITAATGFAASTAAVGGGTPSPGVLGVYGTALGFLSHMERIVGADATGQGTNQTYEYVTVDQGLSDITTERFNIVAGVIIPTTLAIGTSQVSVVLAPGLVVNDATSLTTSPFPNSTVTTNPGKPRFNDTPTTGDILAITSCSTNLLFPFVANSAGFDTGIAIANTSRDPFTSGSSSFLATLPQNGTCTLSGWPAATGTPAVTFTTPSIVAGSTFLTILSSSANASFNGFTGYIIARCNFQFAHGFAFLQNGFGGTPTIAEGYLALIIPDPIILAGVYGSSTTPVGRSGTICAGNRTTTVPSSAAFPTTAGVLASGCIASLGEGLSF